MVVFIICRDVHILSIYMFSSEIEDQPIFPRRLPFYIQSLTDLQRIRLLSSGTFGDVYQYYNSARNEFYAVKKMKFGGRKDYKNIEEIKREIDLLYQVNCRFLIKLLDHFEDENFQGVSFVYLVMEFVDGKDLCESIFKPKIQLQHNIICEIIRDICEGLEYLHTNQIIHRDIKLENVMLSSKGTVKIIDLGQSNYYGDGFSRKTMRGTKSYFSPEVANHDEQDDKVDVWCLGVIVYELVCLDSPFRGSEKEMMENIRRFRYPIPQKIKHQKQLLDLFEKIFTWHPKRITIKQVKQHRWIKKNIQGNSMPKYEKLFMEHQITDYRNWLSDEIDKMKTTILNIRQHNQVIDQFLQQCRTDIQNISRR